MRSTIYNAHFGFRAAPFGLTPDPGVFYFNSIYREALATLVYGLEARRGFVVVTGETGTGKTTLLRKLMGALEPKYKTAYIFNTLVSFADLLRLILTDLGLTAGADDKLEMINRLNEYLLEQHKEGNVVALLIDEAQDLSVDTLEELRLLTNLETDKEKLLQIALVGQLSLERKLNEPQLRQLAQRVALRCRLTSLAANEVGSYLESRLQAVGQKTEDLFERDAVEKIARYSNGIPRLINVICDNALLMAYAASKAKIDGATIDEVADDLFPGQAETGLERAVRQIKPEKNGLEAVPDHEPGSAMTEHRGRDDVSISFAKSRDFHIHKRPNRLQISAAAVLLVGLGGLVYSIRTGLWMSNSSRGDVEMIQSRIDHAGLSRIAARPDAATQQTSVSPVADGFVLDENGSADNPQAPTIVRAAAPHKKSLEIAKPAEIIDDGQSTYRRSREDKRKDQSLGNFNVVQASFVRNKPSANADTISTLEPGTHIVVTRRNGEYYWIQSTGREPIRGYVHREDAFFERSR